MRSSTFGEPGKAALLALSVVLPLAGCGAFDPGSAPPSPSVPPIAAAPLPLPPPRKPPPPGATLARLAPASAEVETPPAVVPLSPAPRPRQKPALPAPPAPSAGNFDRLIGLDQSHVADILGSPRSRAESPPAP